MVKTFIDTRDGSLSDFFTGIRRYWLRAMGVGAVYGIIMTSLVTSAWFYGTRLQNSVPVAGYALSGLASGSALVLASMAPLLPATIVQRKIGVLPTIRLALFLVLANPLLIGALSVQCLILTILSCLIAPLFFAGYASAVICIGSAAYELLARKYDPARDHERDGSDAEDDYLNRGLRDLFFPWKG